jgi:DNA-binding NarL/FixJ family response regulator
MIRVLLVDDHAIVREGYRRLLERDPGIAVVGEASDGQTAYLAFQTLDPDLVVMDISLPGASGIDTLRRIMARAPQARVLMFSMHEEVIFAQRAFLAGASGYVTKASAPDTLVEAVHRVAAGERYIGPDMAQTLALQSVGGDAAGFDELSAREFEVVRLIVAGDSLAQIASKLRLSYKTVANLQSLIRQKLGVQTQVQLLQMAARHGVGRP